MTLALSESAGLSFPSRIVNAIVIPIRPANIMKFCASVSEKLSIYMNAWYPIPLIQCEGPSKNQESLARF